MNYNQGIYSRLLMLFMVIIVVSCMKEMPVDPEITTASVSAITTNSAKSGGLISDDGGVPVISRGVCWKAFDFYSSPTINDKKTTDGSGNGTYSSNLTGLTEGTKYMIRAYVTTKLGTAYGDEKYFTTEESDQFIAKTTDIFRITNSSGYTAASIASYRTANPLKTGTLVINVDHTASGTYTIRLFKPDAPGTVYGTWSLTPGTWKLVEETTLIVGNDWGIQVVLPNNTTSAINFIGRVSSYIVN